MSTLGLRRKIKYVIISILALIILAGIVIYSPLLNIGYVKINGNNTISREEVLHIADLSEPLNVFYVSTSEVKNKLEKDLRIESVKVRREGFNRVVVDLVESQSIAMVETNYGYADINYNGIILKVYKDLPKIHAPLLKGIIVNDAYIGDNINMPNIDKVLVYLQWLAPLYRQQLKEVNVEHIDNVFMETYNNSKVILGNINEPTELAAECNAFFQEINKSELALDYVNFAYTRPVLKFK